MPAGTGDLDFTIASGFPYVIGYCVSKAAANMVVAKYAAELQSEGFTFLAISPGVSSTAVRARELFSVTTLF